MKYSNEEAVDTFLDYIRYFSIAHHVPGRIRVKASLLKARELKKIDGADIEEIVNRISGITGYRLNRKALSAVIEYDNSVIPPTLWEDVITIDSWPARRGEVREKLLTLLG